jgi:hypothetical protein
MSKVYLARLPASYCAASFDKISICSNALSAAYPRPCAGVCIWEDDHGLQDHRAMREYGAHSWTSG